MTEHTINPHDVTWKAIENWIDERLKTRRATLETPGVDLGDTENARGAIEELNELRSLAKPRIMPNNPPDAESLL